MKLAACIVNYHSADFALACARSLVAEWVRLGFEPSDLDLAVVDNGDRELGPAWTEQLEQLGALVVHSDRNRGYAGGIELGFSWTRPADYYLILNPDLYFLPG